MVNTDEHNNKYCNGKIYKITDLGYNECYIGSTVQKLSVRLAGHRRHFRRYKKGEFNMCTSFLSFEKYGEDALKIELVELYPCNTVEELRQREGYWITTETCLNKYVPCRTKQEYAEDNRSRIQMLKKLRYEATKERCYAKHICEVCGKQYTAHHKLRHEKSQKHLTALENK